ncbi:uncharacterized protein LOC131628380 [Vicia villosa]|uniref:uncharacterized protein LOC131628380 n=1 Tax=Vicia villosa TaxID=3911 RepID=UPI00273B03F4|nr:uncharacterized protein LOC131628380 [Vicia villosa]
MSQQPSSSSPKNMSSNVDLSSDSRAQTVNPNEVLDTVPLRMVTADDLKVQKPITPLTRRPKERFTSNVYKSSSPTPSGDKTREGSKYVHNAIKELLTRILSENHDVPGVSVPLNQEINEPNMEAELDVVHDVETMEDTELDPSKEKKVGVDVNVVVEDDTEVGTEADTGTGTGTEVVDLDEYFDNGLIASIDPSIAKRFMTTKGKKVVGQSPSKKKAGIDSSKKDTVGPPRTWSKVIPKKRKVNVISSSDTDVECDVSDIPLKKKPTSSKLATRVPDVPIDNISFHYAASVNKWKYVYCCTPIFYH